MAFSRYSFVDIHSHILPGVDDGVKDPETSLALLKEAQMNGTAAVVLTPHYCGRYRENSADRLVPAYEDLLQKAADHCPGMELYLGCETGYELDISEKLRDGTVLTINHTHYVLLEFRDRAFRSRIMEGTLEILNFGYTPILAHVERYEALRRNPGLIDELIHLGALIQINADSVMGKLGFSIKRFTHRLLKNHQVHFVATDAHDPVHRNAILKDCYDKISRKYGREQAFFLFSKNGRTVLEGGEEIEC